jgi:very-short-patch-repair endonuclease
MHYFEYLGTKRLPKNYWDKDENIIQFLRFIVWRYDIQNIEDWYTKVGTRELTLCGGSNLIKKFETLVNLLNYIYKDIHEFLPWKFFLPQFFWEKEENINYFMRYLCYEKNIKSIEDFYNIKCEDIRNLGGHGLLNRFSGIYNLLNYVYEEKYTFLPWKFNQVPSGFWEKNENHKLYMKWLFKELNYTTVEDKYKLSNKDFEDNYGISLLAGYYNSSPSLILSTLYPEVKWIPWKFKQVPKDFWNNTNNHKLYIEWLYKELNFNCMEDWYTVSMETFDKYFGNGIVRIHGTYFKLLKCIYSDYDWLPWKFKVTSDNFWEKKENHKIYTEWLFNELGYKNMEDWYNLSNQLVFDNYGCGLLSGYYNLSCHKLLENVYSDYKWLQWKFNSVPNNFWKDLNNHKLYLEWLFEELGYNSMEDWYGISQEIIYRNFGRGLIKLHNSSPQQLLKCIYPDYEWIPWKFKSVGPKFWDDLNNHKLYMEWLFEELGYNSMEDWYGISQDLITKNRGCGLINLHYNGSPSLMVKTIYSGYKWEDSRFNCYKGEVFLHNYLLTLNFQIQTQCKFNWCKNELTNKYLPFDFGIEELKILIELDGRQHFEQLYNWDSPELTRKRDNIKMNKAIENGYTIIRLLWDDVYYNKNNWKEKLSIMFKYYEIPQIIYLSDKYKNFY